MNEESISIIKEEEPIKVINNVKSNVSKSDDVNVTLPDWNINPPFEFLDRSEQ